MRTEPGTRSRGIRLYGIALIQQSLGINVLQKIPQCLYIAVIIRDIRIIHIHPVAYALGKGHPFLGVLHHLPAACPVVFLYAYLRPYVLLGDAQKLLHAELHRQPVRIPAGTTLHTIPALRLVAAYRILDGTRHHMVDPRHSVRGWRPFKENELRGSLPHFQGFPESAVLFPSVQHIRSDSHQIKSFILVEFHIFYIILQQFFLSGKRRRHCR